MDAKCSSSPRPSASSPFAASPRLGPPPRRYCTAAEPQVSPELPEACGAKPHTEAPRPADRSPLEAPAEGRGPLSTTGEPVAPDRRPARELACAENGAAGSFNGRNQNSHTEGDSSPAARLSAIGNSPARAVVTSIPSAGAERTSRPLLSRASPASSCDAMSTSPSSPVSSVSSALPVHAPSLWGAADYRPPAGPAEPGAAPAGPQSPTGTPAPLAASRGLLHEAPQSLKNGEARDARDGERVSPAPALPLSASRLPQVSARDDDAGQALNRGEEKGGGGRAGEEAIAENGAVAAAAAQERQSPTSADSATVKGNEEDGDATTGDSTVGPCAGGGSVPAGGETQKTTEAAPASVVPQETGWAIPRRTKRERDRQARARDKIVRQHAVYRRLSGGAPLDEGLRSDRACGEEDVRLDELLKKGDFSGAAFLLTQPVVAKAAAVSASSPGARIPKRSSIRSLGDAGTREVLKIEGPATPGESAASFAYLANNAPCDDEPADGSAESVPADGGPAMSLRRRCGARGGLTGEKTPTDQTTALSREARRLAEVWASCVQAPDAGDEKTEAVRLLGLSLQASSVFAVLTLRLERSIGAACPHGEETSRAAAAAGDRQGEALATPEEREERNRVAQNRNESLRLLRDSLLRATQIGHAAVRPLTELSLRRAAEQLTASSARVGLRPRAGKRETRKGHASRKPRGSKRQKTAESGEDAGDSDDQAEDDRKDVAHLRETAAVLAASLAAGIVILQAALLCSALSRGAAQDCDSLGAGVSSASSDPTASPSPLSCVPGKADEAGGSGVKHEASSDPEDRRKRPRAELETANRDAGATDAKAPRWQSAFARGFKLQCAETVAVLLALSGPAKTSSGDPPLAVLQSLLPASVRAKLLSLFASLCRLIRKSLFSAYSPLPAATAAFASSSFASSTRASASASGAGGLAQKPIMQTDMRSGGLVGPPGTSAAASARARAASVSPVVAASTLSPEHHHLLVAGLALLFSRPSAGLSPEAAEALQEAADLLTTYFAELPSFRAPLLLALLASLPPCPSASLPSPSTHAAFPGSSPALLRSPLRACGPAKGTSSFSSLSLATSLPPLRSLVPQLLPLARLLPRLLQCLFLPRLRRRRSAAALSASLPHMSGAKGGDGAHAGARRVTSVSLRRGERAALFVARVLLAHVFPQGIVQIAKLRKRDTWNCEGVGFRELLFGAKTRECGGKDGPEGRTTRDGDIAEETDDEADFGSKEFANAAFLLDSDTCDGSAAASRATVRRFIEEWGLMSFYPACPGAFLLFRTLIASLLHLVFSVVPLDAELVARVLKKRQGTGHKAALLAGLLLSQREEIPLAALVASLPSASASLSAGSLSSSSPAGALFSLVETGLQLLSAAVPFMFLSASSLTCAAAPRLAPVRALAACDAGSAAKQDAVHEASRSAGAEASDARGGGSGTADTRDESTDAQQAPGGRQASAARAGPPASLLGRASCCLCGARIGVPGHAAEPRSALPAGPQSDSGVDSISPSPPALEASPALVECEDCWAWAHATCAGMAAAAGLLDSSSSSRSMPCARVNGKTLARPPAAGMTPLALDNTPWLCEGCALRRTVAYGIHRSAERIDATARFLALGSLAACDSARDSTGRGLRGPTERPRVDGDAQEAVPASSPISGSRDELGTYADKCVGEKFVRALETEAPLLPMLPQPLVYSCLLLAHLNGPGGRAACVHHDGAPGGLHAGGGPPLRRSGAQSGDPCDRFALETVQLEAFGVQEESENDSCAPTAFDQVAVRMAALSFLDEAATGRSISVSGPFLEPGARGRGAEEVNGASATDGGLVVSQRYRKGTKGDTVAKSKKQRAGGNEKERGETQNAREQQGELPVSQMASHRSVPSASFVLVQKERALWDVICALESRAAGEMRRGFGLSRRVRGPRHLAEGPVSIEETPGNGAAGESAGGPGGCEERGALSGSEEVETHTPGPGRARALGRSSDRLKASAQREEDEGLLSFDEGSAMDVWRSEVVEVFLADLRTLFIFAVQSSLPRRYTVGIKRAALTALSSCLQLQPQALEAAPELQQTLWFSLRDPAPAVRDRALAVIEKVMFSPAALARLASPSASPHQPWPSPADAEDARHPRDEALRRHSAQAEGGRTSADLFAAFLASSLVHDASPAVRLQAVRMLRNYYVCSPRLHSRFAARSSADASLDAAPSPLACPVFKATRDAFLSLARRLCVRVPESRQLRATILDLFAQFFFLQPFTCPSEEPREGAAEATSSPLHARPPGPRPTFEPAGAPPRDGVETPPAALVALLSCVAAALRGANWRTEAERDEGKAEALAVRLPQAEDALTRRLDEDDGASADGHDDSAVVPRLLALATQRLACDAQTASAIVVVQAFDARPSTPPCFRGRTQERQAFLRSGVDASTIRLSTSSPAGGGAAKRRAGSAAPTGAQALETTRAIVGVWLEAILRLFLRRQMQASQPGSAAAFAADACAAGELLDLSREFVSGRGDRYGAGDVLVRSFLPLLLPLFKQSPPVSAPAAALLDKGLGFVAALCSLVGAGGARRAETESQARGEGRGLSGDAADSPQQSFLCLSLSRELHNALPDIHCLVEGEPLLVKEGVRCLYAAATQVTGDLHTHIGRLLGCSLAHLYDAQARLQAFALWKLHPRRRAGPNERPRGDADAEDDEDGVAHPGVASKTGAWSRDSSHTEAGAHSATPRQPPGDGGESRAAREGETPHRNPRARPPAFDAEAGMPLLPLSGVESGDAFCSVAKPVMSLGEILHNAQYASWVAARLACELDFEADFLDDLDIASECAGPEEPEDMQKRHAGDETEGGRGDLADGAAHEASEQPAGREGESDAIQREGLLSAFSSRSSSRTPLRGSTADSRRSRLPLVSVFGSRFRASSSCLPSRVAGAASCRLSLRRLRQAVQSLTPHLPALDAAHPLASSCSFSFALGAASAGPARPALGASGDSSDEETDRGYEDMARAVWEMPRHDALDCAKEPPHLTQPWDLRDELFRLLVDILFLLELLRLPGSVVWRSFSHFLGSHASFVCHRSVHTLFAAVLSRGASGHRMRFPRWLRRQLLYSGGRGALAASAASSAMRDSAGLNGHAALEHPARVAAGPKFGVASSRPASGESARDALSEDASDCEEESPRRRGGLGEAVPADEKDDENAGAWGPTEDEAEELGSSRDSAELQAALQGLGALLLAFETQASQSSGAASRSGLSGQALTPPPQDREAAEAASTPTKSFVSASPLRPSSLSDLPRDRAPWLVPASLPRGVLARAVTPPRGAEPCGASEFPATASASRASSPLTRVCGSASRSASVSRTFALSLRKGESRARAAGGRADTRAGYRNAVTACEAAQSLTVHLPSLLQILLPDSQAVALQRGGRQGPASAFAAASRPSAWSTGGARPARGPPTSLGLSVRSAELCLQVLRVFQRQGLVHSGEFVAHAFACLCATSQTIRHAAADLLRHAFPAVPSLSSRGVSASSSALFGDGDSAPTGARGPRRAGRAARDRGAAGLLTSRLHDALFLAVKFALSYAPHERSEDGIPRNGDAERESLEAGRGRAEEAEGEMERDATARDQRREDKAAGAKRGLLAGKPAETQCESVWLEAVKIAPFELLPPWTTPATFSQLFVQLSEERRGAKAELLWSLASQLDQFAEPTRLALLLTLLPPDILSHAPFASSPASLSLCASHPPAAASARASASLSLHASCGPPRLGAVARLVDVEAAPSCPGSASLEALPSLLRSWLAHPALAWLRPLLGPACVAGKPPAAGAGGSAGVFKGQRLPTALGPFSHSAARGPSAPAEVAGLLSVPVNLVCLPVLVLLCIQQTVSLLLALPLPSEADAFFLVFRLEELAEERAQRILAGLWASAGGRGRRPRRVAGERGEELESHTHKQGGAAVADGLLLSSGDEAALENSQDEGDDNDDGDSVEASVVVLCQILSLAFAVLCRRALLRAARVEEARYALFRALKKEENAARVASQTLHVKQRKAGAWRRGGRARPPSAGDAELPSASDTSAEPSDDDERGRGAEEAATGARHGRRDSDSRAARASGARKRRKTQIERGPRCKAVSSEADDDAELWDTALSQVCSDSAPSPTMRPPRWSSKNAGDLCRGRARLPPRRRHAKPERGRASRGRRRRDSACGSEGPTSDAPSVDVGEGRARGTRRARKGTGEKSPSERLRLFEESLLAPRTRGALVYAPAEAEALVRRIGEAWVARLQPLLHAEAEGAAGSGPEDEALEGTKAETKNAKRDTGTTRGGKRGGEETKKEKNAEPTKRAERKLEGLAELVEGLVAELRRGDKKGDGANGDGEKKGRGATKLSRAKSKKRGREASSEGSELDGDEEDEDEEEDAEAEASHDADDDDADDSEEEEEDAWTSGSSETHSLSSAATEASVAVPSSGERPRAASAPRRGASKGGTAGEAPRGVAGKTPKSLQATKAPASVSSTDSLWSNCGPTRGCPTAAKGAGWAGRPASGASRTRRGGLAKAPQRPSQGAAVDGEPRRQGAARPEARPERDAGRGAQAPRPKAATKPTRRGKEKKTHAAKQAV
ncbi:hypothetical protein BESB_053710 [Besnoitia besnoiti]|uniref:Uncharacterized protein n=1 Tax=Besnoitia besnoiti TaxID=94643 RepID=A0A2A9MJY7_BESBE|nr:hypothetical protein BESB_053710 [Besnoitia besnoiti]PFH35720.1 hypothetical protein BESB_053710 [Besnoitia besnoiti]